MSLILQPLRILSSLATCQRKGRLMQRGCGVIRRGYCDVEVAKEDCCKRVKKERYPVALQ